LHFFAFGFFDAFGKIQQQKTLRMAAQYPKIDHYIGGVQYFIDQC
jgi:hypothetical protein